MSAISADVIKAAGGVVQAGDGRVLMILRNGVWDLPKGKIESGESVEEAAIREVEEETGLRGLSIRQSLGTTKHSYILNGKLIEKTTWWFLMSLDTDLDPEALFLSPQIEEGITHIAWEEVKQAKMLAGFENLKMVLDRV